MRSDFSARQLKRGQLDCSDRVMRVLSVVVISGLLVACHRSIEVSGLYVNDFQAGDFFPCDQPNTVWWVNDSALATSYRLKATTPSQRLFVRLRGVRADSGGIYGHKGVHRYQFLVRQVFEMRARREGECPSISDTVAHMLHLGESAGRQSDSAFAAMQARGQTVMGVDQYASGHVFEDLGDGGRIVLDADNLSDTAGIVAIRQHMRDIATAFRAGDFAKPFRVHAQVVPGTSIMAARRTEITYEATDRPRGAEVRIRTTDSAAVAAIHAFLAFQRTAHHAAGHEAMPSGGH